MRDTSATYWLTAAIGLITQLAPSASATRPSTYPSVFAQPYSNSLVAGTSHLLTPADYLKPYDKATRDQQHTEENLCSDFLEKHLPERDRGAIASVYLNRNIELALQARRANSWAEAVPFDVFLNYVLPYASLDERREGWRRLFCQELEQKAAEASSLTDATNKLNQYIWGRWRIRLKAEQQPQVMAPSEVIATGEASRLHLAYSWSTHCGLSEFLHVLLVGLGFGLQGLGHRSKGLTRHAQGLGTVAWRASGGASHTWVEAWDKGRWSFIDPGEYRPVNDTWFYPYPAQMQVMGSTNYSIVAATFEQGSHGFYPLPWSPRERGIPGIDVTAHYLK